MNRILAAAAVLAGAVLGCAATARADAALPPLQLSAGPVQGIRSADGAARVWLGLPYAEPPVGALRWQPPQPMAPWKELRRADAFGSPCVQTGSMYGPPPPGKVWGLDNVETFGKPIGSEDCLTLNIWRPVSEERGLPVLVFVHGGANVAGYSADPTYDGARLAVAAKAVVVTINYRLGIFGWFADPVLQGPDPLANSGEFGILDIIQSLRFVQANIAAFGGDPGNVTLMGQSAGAIDIYAIIGSKLAGGLFHKAIVLSGLIGSAGKPNHHSYATDLAAELALHDGLAATPEAAANLLAAKGAPWVKDYLLSRSSSEILDATHRNLALSKAPPTPGDGVVLPLDLAAAYEQGQFQRVPMIIGTTRDEAKLFTNKLLKVGNEQRFRMMLQSDPDAAPEYRPADLISPYLLPWLSSAPYDFCAWLLSAVLGHAVNSSIDKVAKYEPRVYAYRFDWNRGPEPWQTVYGAAHAIDLPFIFGNFDTGFFAMDFSAGNRPGREALSRVMMQTIGAFLRSGDPNVPALGLRWQPWHAGGTRQKLVLDASDQGLNLSLH